MVRIADQRAGKLVVAKVHTEALHEVAARFNIRSIPRMIHLLGGRETQRSSGARSAEATMTDLSV
jgi:thioredoxin-like negative regulator of GroEL